MACGKVITPPLVTVAGVVLGSVPDDAVAAGNIENRMVSPLPTPAPAALALIVTVVPVVDSTVVAAEIEDGVVALVIVMPATIQAGVDAKWSVGLPLAVVLLVAADPAT